MTFVIYTCTRRPPPLPSPPNSTNLEEVDLHSAVAEVEHDGALRAEPVAQVGQACELVPVTRRYVSACFQQVLAHVVPEVLQQRDLKERTEGKRVGAETMTGNESVMECSRVTEILLL